MTSPTIPIHHAIELANRIYRRNCVGCCLHIVLDDGNIEDSHVAFCVEQTNKPVHKGPHDDCRELADLMMTFSKTQRRKVINSKLRT